MIRSIKYFLFDLIILLVVFAGNELYQLYLYDFEDFPQTSFYVQENIPTDEMREDIFSADEKFDLEVMYIEKVVQGDYYTRVNIYSSPTAKEILESKYHIHEGTCKGLFSGKSEVFFNEDDSLPDETMKKNGEGYFIIGSIDSAREYKRYFNDKYGGNIPFGGDRDSVREIILKYVFIWVSAVVVLTIVSYYSACRLRKEFAIRCTMGESIKRLIISNCLYDAVDIILAFVIISIISHLYSNISFLINVQLVSVFAFLIINSLIICWCTRGSIRYALSHISVSLSVLRTEYFLKAIITVIVAICLATSVTVVSRYFNLREQSGFYDNLDEYSYVTIRTRNINEVLDAEKEFYRHFFTEFDIKYAGIYEVFGNYDNNDFIVGFNKNLAEYVFERFKLSPDEYNEEDFILLIPEEKEVDEETISMVTSGAAAFCNTTPEEMKTVFYTDNVEIDYYDDYSGYSRRKNLVVVYNGRTENMFLDDENWGMPVFFQRCMMKVDEAALKEFCEKNNCDYSIGNVKEEFLYELEKSKRGALINLVFISLLVTLQAIISFSIVKLEFEANRMEIILRRIYGNSAIVRYSKIVAPIYAVGVLSVIATLVCYRLMALEHAAVAVILITMMSMAESILITIRFRYLEEECIHITLKGGW